MTTAKPAAKRAGRATITQLASLLGMAPSTVSRAFTRPNLLRPETVELVRNAAEAAGYVPNSHARALATGRAGVIGMVVPDIANPFFPPIIRAAQSLASDAGLAVYLADTDENSDREDQLISRMAPQVEGIVSVSSRLSSARVKELARSQRIAFINRDVPGTHRVLLSTAEAIGSAMDHLLALGHLNIGYVGGPEGSWSNKERRRAIETHTSRRSMKITYFQAQPGTYSAARDLSRAVMDAGVTAVIAFDDVIAHGLMGGFAALGVSVPQDISVIGCDDTLAATTFPALSTISVNATDAARTAVQALISTAGTQPLPPERIVIKGALVIRGTTGPSPASTQSHAPAGPGSSGVPRLIKPLVDQPLQGSPA